MKVKLGIILISLLFSPSYCMETTRKKKKKSTQNRIEPIVQLVQNGSSKEISDYFEKHPQAVSTEDENGNNLVQIALLAKREDEIMRTLIPYTCLTKCNNLGDDVAETVMSFGVKQREKYIPIIAEGYLDRMEEETRVFATQVANTLTEKHHKDFSLVIAYLLLKHSLVCEPKHTCLFEENEG